MPQSRRARRTLLPITLLLGGLLGTGPFVPHTLGAVSPTGASGPLDMPGLAGWLGLALAVAALAMVAVARRDEQAAKDAEAARLRDAAGRSRRATHRRSPRRGLAWSGGVRPGRSRCPSDGVDRGDGRAPGHAGGAAVGPPHRPSARRRPRELAHRRARRRPIGPATARRTAVDAARV